MKQMVWLILFAALSSFAQHHDSKDGDEHGVLPAGFEIKTAEGGRIDRQVDFPAEIRVDRSRFAAVSPRYAGTVRELHAEPGDAVKQGDVLAVMENRETLATYTLLSPLTGTVISRNQSVGESVGEDTVLFEVADLSSVWVAIHIFPQYRQAVRKGAAVQLVAPDNRTAQARIEYMSPLVSPETRTFEARCELSNPDGGFAPGSFVRARISVESIQADVRVENAAVQNLNGETVVFVQDADGLEPRDVKTGLADGAFVEIKSGLQPGDAYVARGAFELKAAQVVNGLGAHAGHGH